MHYKGSCQKCGINRRIPRSILYGSSNRQGLGVKDLLLLQGIHRLVDYWVHIGRFSADYQNRISWKTVERTAAILSAANKRFVSKWVSEECGVSTTLTKWNHRYINGCPFCLSPNENTEHVLCCPHESANRIWCEQLSSLDTKLRKLHTQPNLHKLIISRLRTWHDNNTEEVTFTVERDIATAIAHQTVIGWRAFFRRYYFR
jgi:hypothetical protein